MQPSKYGGGRGEEDLPFIIKKVLGIMHHLTRLTFDPITVGRWSVGAGSAIYCMTLVIRLWGQYRLQFCACVWGFRYLFKSQGIVLSSRVYICVCLQIVH
jgi:hypothetical protein